MQKSFLLYVALSGLCMFSTPSFANVADALFPIGQPTVACVSECPTANGGSDKANLLKEIRELVEEYMLRPPADIGACVWELYEEREENRNAEEHCGDVYARIYTADERKKRDDEASRMLIVPILRADKGILVIPTFFYNDPDMAIEQSALDLLSRGAAMLYFDLRGNLGGFVENALKLLYHFAREDDRFITLRFRTKESVVYDTAMVRKKYELKHPPGILRKVPTCVIIDGNSASASEIFAGVMKDWGYCVAGNVSYKKGVGQSIFRLADGLDLRITAYEFFVGNSQTKIHGIGVIPNAPLPDEMREP